MCEFCLKHGEGKKWYLQAKNYSADLLSDVHRREFVREFFTDTDSFREQLERMSSLDRAPEFVRRVVAWRATGRMKRLHFGQVVPIEEIDEILGFVTSIVRVACVCRYTTLGAEKRFCYGVSLGPNGGLREILKGLDGSFLSGPSTAGLEKVSREEARAAMKELEKDGLCHTVWTFGTPFIGGICNCDRADCLAMRSTIRHGIKVMFRGEHVAEIDPEACGGCRECLRVCPFGALEWSASNRKASVDPRHCWGCGVCRSSCSKDAVRLVDRASVPAAARVW